eukprot:scaffold69543_cov29-Prasinocladus_malaysianus.AAC.2
MAYDGTHHKQGVGLSVRGSVSPSECMCHQSAARGGRSINGLVNRRRGSCGRLTRRGIDMFAGTASLSVLCSGRPAAEQQRPPSSSARPGVVLQAAISTGCCCCCLGRCGARQC